MDESLLQWPASHFSITPECSLVPGCLVAVVVGVVAPVWPRARAAHKHASKLQASDKSCHFAFSGGGVLPSPPVCTLPSMLCH